MNHLIEIRSINLKLDTCEKFYRLYIEEAPPLLQCRNFDLMVYGPSLHDDNTSYVIRRQHEPMEAD